MKSILHFFILLFFTFTLSFSNEFAETKNIVLKKDEQKKIFVKYNNRKKLLTFRWTLYKNGGLIIFSSYDKIVSQHILYLRHTNQSFRLKLKPSDGYYNPPYLLIKFKKFDKQKKEASIDFMLSDRSGFITIEYVKNN